ADDALIAKAQETALFPECPSALVSRARQIHPAEDGAIPNNVVVELRASSGCMEKWARRLDEGGWRLAGHHGGGFRSPDGSIVASPGLRDLPNDGYVMWFQDEFEPGVPD